MEKKEKVLNITKVIPVLFHHWKYYLYATIGVVAFSLIFIFTIPRYYSCKVMLAPEPTDDKGGLSSIMSSFGLGNMDKTDDAISPMMYPDLMESRDFVTSLFPVRVTTKKGDVSTTYYDYLKNHNKDSWYMSCIGSLFEMIDKKEDTAPSTVQGGKKHSPGFMLTKDQDEIAQVISGKIKYDYDKKTGVVSVTVKDQDPLVCALIADTVSKRLQDFITEYRTKKARKNLEYSKKIYAIAKAEYEGSTARYAAAVDGNWDIVSETAKAQITKLEKDKDLKFSTFSTISQQLEKDKAKLQEVTPVISVLQNASVPIKPAGPKRAIITIILLVMVYMGISVYLFEKELAR